MLRQRLLLLLCGDFFVFVLSWCIMAIVRFDVGAQGSRIWFQLAIFGMLFLLWITVFYIFELYNFRNVNPNPRTIGMLIAAMTINVSIAITTFYLIPQSGISPKTTLVLFSTTAFFLLVIWRRMYYLVFTSKFSRSIGIIGTSPLILHLKKELEDHPHIGVITRHWNTDEIDEKIFSPVDILVTESVDPRALLFFSQKLKAEVLSLSSAYETLFGKIPALLMNDEKAVHVITKESNKGVTIISRIIEITVALFILIVASPLLLITALCIHLDTKGPIILGQTRVGKNGTVFTLYKFRSMVSLNKDGSAEADGAVWADKKDTRITKVGNIIRTLHIDEIPQMFNILKGDIALVGPRPERPELVALLEREIPYYFLRHTIRPGFTGWAQIKFRYARTILDSQEKFEYDLYYLSNKNPLLDIGIFLKTVQIIFTH